MTIGDIKAEALRLMHIDRVVSVENINDIEYDDNWGDLVRNMTGAIDRCFADLTARRILPLLRVQLEDPEGRGAWRRFSLAGVANLFCPERLVAESDMGVVDDHPFVLEGETLRVDDYDEGTDYYLLYHRRLPHLTDATSNADEVPLPEELAVAVPWYVMGDVWRVDEPEEAEKGRSMYETMIARYLESRPAPVRQTVVDNVFGGLL